MAFEGLTEKISAAFKRLRGKGRLKESDVKEAMREIRMALLEADVSYKVVKDFIKGVTEKAVGTEVLESLTAGQAIVKIVNQELIDLMGGSSAKIGIQRYKGLGEMDPEELRETTLDPANRTLVQVTMEDAEAADDLFRILMGDKVEPRREFIEKFALDVKYLDV